MAGVPVPDINIVTRNKVISVVDCAKDKSEGGFLTQVDHGQTLLNLYGMMYGPLPGGIGIKFLGV